MKFNIGDNVRAIGSLAIDGEHNRLGVIESVGTEESWVKWETELGIFSCKVSNNQLELIEQDTKEETPTEKCCDETVVPDYNPKEDLLNRIIVIAAAGINDDRLFEECLKDIISQYEISELI
jgi:hypothetical protein